jgi:parvulin-like peptidyl-prolyl isomerase
MRISRKLAALGAFFVLAAATVAGCGSSNSVGGNSVAVVAGNQISLKSYKHWSYVAAKGNAAQEAQQGESVPVVVASDPPNFKSCIQQARAQVPQLKTTSAKELKSDCGQLFSQSNSQVMGLLVESAWYQADAHKLGITVTQKQIDAAYAKTKKQNFPTKQEYTAYLSETGMTDADFRFETRVNAIYQKLAKRYTKKVTPAAISSFYKAHPSDFGKHESLKKATPAIKSELTSENEQAVETKVTKLSEKNWGKQTICAKQFVTATYCGNYKAPKTTATTPPTTSTPASGSSTPASSSTSSGKTTTSSK